MLLALATIALVAVAAYTDYRRGVIPNWLTLPALAAPPLVYYALHDAPGLWFSLIGLFGCGLVPYLLFRMDALGGGDVKLLAALGALHGLSLGLEMLILSFLASCVWAVGLLAVRRQLGTVLANSLQLTLNAVRPRRLRREIPRAAMTELRMAPLIAAATLFVLVTV